MTSTHIVSNSNINKIDHNSISESIEGITGLESISSIYSNTETVILEREAGEYQGFENLWNIYFGEQYLRDREEVKRTIDFLGQKFVSLFPILLKQYNISEEVFMGKISQRLAHQISEAQESGRVFINGTIGSLRSIDIKGGLIIEKIPYWAFGSTNVSLDAIKFESSQGGITLRQVMEGIGYKDDVGEFLLPNSLGVSVMIQLADGTIIAQKRNNKKVLTQYNGLCSSASGAVSIFDCGNQNGIDIIRSNAVAEVVEELGLESEFIPYLPETIDISRSIQSCILEELGISNASGILVPVGIVMERKRHNPEVVFTFVLSEKINLETLLEKWSTAKDKWESIGLIGLTPQTIEDQIYFYQNNIPDVLKNKPNGIEEYISTLSGDTEWVGPHLLMSYLAWRKAIEDIMNRMKNRVQSVGV